MRFEGGLAPPFENGYWRACLIWSPTQTAHSLLSSTSWGSFRCSFCVWDWWWCWETLHRSCGWPIHSFLVQASMRWCLSRCPTLWDSFLSRSIRSWGRKTASPRETDTVRALKERIRMRLSSVKSKKRRLPSSSCSRPTERGILQRFLITFYLSSSLMTANFCFSASPTAPEGSERSCPMLLSTLLLMDAFRPVANVLSLRWVSLF